MEQLSLSVLLGTLVCLIIISAFFSGSETGMMASNRYRMRHKMRQGHRAAKRVIDLLSRPDRLLGTILIGNTFANILAASIATIIGARLLGDLGIWLSTIVLTFVVLVFAEVTPKTLAALQPDRSAELVSMPMGILLKLFYPLVILINFISNGLLRLIGVRTDENDGEHLTQEELRSIVNETSQHIPQRNKTMLLRLLDLKQVTVDDIMVPRSEIIGLDMSDTWEQILVAISATQHTRLPVFTDSIDNLTGVLHIRNLLSDINHDEFNKERLLSKQDEVYYVPAGTPLTIQLLNFQKHKSRLGFVVDEYGDIQGLVTLDDILEEIVGEFTTDMSAASRDITKEEGNTYLIDGTATIREINRALHLELPVDGPKTLSGLIIEYLEVIPAAGTGCRISGYPIEVIHIKDNMIKTARIMPKLRIKP